MAAVSLSTIECIFNTSHWEHWRIFNGDRSDTGS
jgi:hypothetical protein